ncbi:Eco57I restriction-modification methylase (plasmid) [Legionella adelaidensis]|uniref:Eco57I restriction-modification methylase n=1 Tax=Legionella adelaidensis TaxID=45056 RepID=A0A0W0R0M5_9GAMM|nr:Eco57I restriction-modification methylase domain-containing protein [Legionella adelaidensis]KTC64597.1 Eco57I restriction-modification methylase [Legionella adelaidensis]VEH86065.1 Eco57I restriction-modification methylase [Legionella adelaidensis]
MEPNLKLNVAHVVDTLGNVIGRDQQIMTMEKACDLVSLIDEADLRDSQVVFFDPFCKAGEILLACAHLSCFAKSCMDVRAVQKELYESGRYFGLSPDERHHRLSLRTFLGNTHSHDERLQQMIKNGNYLSEIDGCLDRKKFIEEFNKMLEYISNTSKPKKIIAVGNPPYQEKYKSNGSNSGANLIYHHLLNSIMDHAKINEFIMVIPARWFAGGRGKSLRIFASKLRLSKQLKQICDFQNSKMIFPQVDVKGGVCFVHWDRDYSGDTLFVSQDEPPIYVDLSSDEIIMRSQFARTVVNKVKARGLASMSKYARSWNIFDLASNYFDKHGDDNGSDVIDCFTKQKVIRKIDRAKIKSNKLEIDMFKVVVPKAVGTGGDTYRKEQVFILEKGQICTETYMVLGSFSKRQDAELLLNYLQTGFVRFLVSVKKITQDITKDTWCLVPCVDITKKWTDKDLFELFQLTPEEQVHIRQKVLEWS